MSGERQEIIEDRRCVPFAQVEACVLRDPTLSMQAKALYGLLISYGPDRIFPGQERLATEAGTTIRTVRRWLNELRDHELIIWERRGSLSNLYTILGPNYVDGTQVSDRTGQERPIRPDTGVPRSISTYPEPLIQPAEDGATAPVVTFQQWQKQIKETTNRPEELRKMCIALYPGLDPPSHGRIGTVAIKVGGAGRLAELLWQHSTRPPTGKLMSYIQGVAKNNGRPNAHQNPHGTTEPVELATGFVEDTELPSGPDPPGVG